VEGTRIVVLEAKWEDTSTIVSKVHGIPILKAAAEDKFCLPGYEIFMKYL
jgi:hypothetical protein